MSQQPIEPPVVVIPPGRKFLRGFLIFTLVGWIVLLAMFFTLRHFFEQSAPRPPAAQATAHDEDR